MLRDINKRVERPALSGFSLVELAISITVVGLVVALVVKGGEMIDNAKISSTILQIESYKAGVDGFRTAYNAWPGDFDGAETYIENCDADPECLDGDGNGAIGNAAALNPAVRGAVAGADETVGAWRHLFLSGYGIGIPSGGTVAFGSALPAAGLGGGFELFYDSDLDISGDAATVVRDGHLLRYAGVVKTSGNLGTGEGVFGFAARALDRKMDDGNPVAGIVYSQNVGSGCIGSDSSSGTTVYFYDEDELDTQNCLVFIEVEG